MPKKLCITQLTIIRQSALVGQYEFASEARISID